jgi:CBS-domain-containing membrane protein
MSPRRIADLVHRDTPLIRHDEPIEAAVPRLLDSGLPALPVVDDRERFAGIFGEREFITALFPGYVGTLGSAGFVPKSIDVALEKRQACRVEPVSKHMNTEHVDVGPDFSDVGLAEIFLHHRVLIIPVTDQKRVVGVITRSDFFAALAERFLANSR